MVCEHRRERQAGLGSSPALRFIALAQASQYLGTGVWALLSMRSFERVTGPKVEHWLVRTVSVLVVAIGTVLGMAALRRAVNGETVTLGAGSAAGIGVIEAYYALRGRISVIYFLDACVQTVFAAGWLFGARAARNRIESPPVNGDVEISATPTRPGPRANEPA